MSLQEEVRNVTADTSRVPSHRNDLSSDDEGTKRQREIFKGWFSEATVGFHCWTEVVWDILLFLFVYPVISGTWRACTFTSSVMT